MEITEHKEGNIVVLKLNGRLDHAGAEVFDDIAVTHIANGCRSMIIDFNHTSFVASMGIRALMIPAQEISRQGGRFALTGLSDSVQKLFEVSGLMKMFKVYASVEEAAADGTWA